MAGIPPSDKPPLGVVRDVIQRYAAILESSKNVIDDEGILPASKDTIKKCLLIGLAIERNAAMRDWLKGGYVMLAHFQPLTSAERAVVANYAQLEKAVSPEMANHKPDEAKSRLAALYAIFPAYQALVDRCLADQLTLMDELRHIGVT